MQTPFQGVSSPGFAMSSPGMPAGPSRLTAGMPTTFPASGTPAQGVPTNLDALADIWFDAINSVSPYYHNKSMWDQSMHARLVLAASPFVRLKTDIAKFDYLNKASSCFDNKPCWTLVTTCDSEGMRQCPLMCGQCEPSKPVGYYPAQELLKNRTNLSLRSRISLSLAFLLRPGLAVAAAATTNPSGMPALQQKEVKSIAKALFADGLKNIEETVQLIMNNLRVQGRTAYVTESVGSKRAAPMDLQAEALEVLVLNSQSRTGSNLLIEKLANYLSSDAASGGGLYFWSGDWNLAQVATALGTYDAARGTINPALELTVYSGDKVLLSGKFNSPTDPIVKATSDSIPEGGVNFKCEGKGEVSVAIGARFIPAKVSPDPVYRGIFLEKTIKRVHFTNRSEYGAALDLVERGAILAVTLQLTTPDDLTDVTLTDLLPGGLEPELPQRPAPTDYSIQPSFGPFRPCWWGYCSPFGEPAINPDRVVWKAARVYAGTHSLSYFVYANTPGRWNLPPAKASVDGQPELMGLSGGGLFLVSRNKVPAAQISQYYQANQMTPVASWMPKDCPETCGSNEQCDVKRGVCVAAAFF